MGSFMFLGPTGVGKTELTGAGRVSCSTTRPRWSASTCPNTWRSIRSSRLIGAPPGYVGYEEGGALTEAVRRRPYRWCCSTKSRRRIPTCSTCCSRCWTTAGSPTAGRTVDFRNTLIIMTSNLGSENLVNQPEGQDTSAVREQVMGTVRGAFPA